LLVMRPRMSACSFPVLLPRGLCTCFWICCPNDTRSPGSVITSHSVSYHCYCYADDTQLFLSFSPSDTQIATRISQCLANISKWTTANQLDMTEILFMLEKTALRWTYMSPVFEDIEVSPSQTARNVGVVLDQLCCNANITSVALYNIGRIRPFLTREAAQILVQALVITHIDYCNFLLVGLLASAIKPLQQFQNAAARLVFNLPKL